MSRHTKTARRQVFVNCPFDAAYRPLFHAIIFTLKVCDYEPRSALEADNAVETRFEKIVRIIRGCSLGIHDISRTESSADGLPRFNMPLELGLFLGAAKYGSSDQRRKIALVLDRERFRFQRYLSDIAGQDIRAHDNKPENLIHEVRKWLAAVETGQKLLGGQAIAKLYRAFQAQLPLLLSELKLQEDEVEFNDLVLIITNWLASLSAADRAN